MGRPSRAAFVAVEGKTIVGFVAARRTRRYGWRADVPRIREGLGRHLRDLQAFVTGLLFDETRITSAGRSGSQLKNRSRFSRPFGGGFCILRVECWANSFESRAGYEV
jgi:hypothetical protein